MFGLFSDHNALQSVGKVGNRNARAQRWLEYFTTFDFALESQKGRANSKTQFMFHLPQPLTEHNHRGSSRLTSIGDGGIHLIRAFGFRNCYLAVPGVLEWVGTPLK